MYRQDRFYRRDDYRSLDTKNLESYDIQTILESRAKNASDVAYRSACDKEIRNRKTPRIEWLVERLLPDAGKDVLVDIQEYYFHMHAEAGWGHAKNYDEWFERWIALHIMRRRQLEHSQQSSLSRSDIKKAVPPGVRHLALMVGEDIRSAGVVISTMDNIERYYGEILRRQIYGHMDEEKWLKYIQREAEGTIPVSYSFIQQSLHKGTEIFVERMQGQQSQLLEEYTHIVSFFEIEKHISAEPELLQLTIDAKLTPIERVVFLLRQTDELDIQYIASKIGQSVDSVTSQLDTAKEKIALYKQAQEQKSKSKIRKRKKKKPKTEHTPSRRGRGVEFQHLCDTQRSRIEKLLKGYSETVRIAITLVYFEGQSTRSVSEQLGMQYGKLARKLQYVRDAILARIDLEERMIEEELPDFQATVMRMAVDGADVATIAKEIDRPPTVVGGELARASKKLEAGLHGKELKPVRGTRRGIGREIVQWFSQDSDAFRSALELLAPTPKRAIMLVDVEGKTLVEAAAELGVTVRSLIGRLNKARKKLLAMRNGEVVNKPGRARRGVGADFPEIQAAQPEVFLVAIEQVDQDFYRRLLKMFYIEGKTIAEISEIVGLAVNTVRVRMTRAKKALKAELESKGLAAK